MCKTEFAEGGVKLHHLARKGFIKIVFHLINFLAEVPIMPVGLYANVLTRVTTQICHQVPFTRKLLFKILQNS